jgi:15-cis-phytoene desaturase
MMAQLAMLMAGLLLLAESQASDMADHSTPQGFLSNYDKFITPSLNRANQGASPFTIVDDKPAPHPTAQVLANDNNSISFAAIGVGLLSLVTMLGFRLRRRLQPASVLAGCGALALDMPMNTASALGDNVMEMKSQDSAAALGNRLLELRAGWGQLSSQNTLPSTMAFAEPNAEPNRAQQMRRNFPKPNVEDTDPYREGSRLSDRFQTDLSTFNAGPDKKKTVAIIGGGLSGLSCAKYLSDAGHIPTVYEARDVLGGKVSAWQDSDGDWIETGLHIFFGAYPNMMRLFKELNIEDRLQWKVHKMVFAMQELPGEFTTFDFIKGIPAPFNFGLAILLNQKMLTLEEKLQTAPPLLPMLVNGQDFINDQDELSVLDFMQKYGMPDRINEEVFISMAKALDFIDPEKLSMTVVLTAMNRFLNEDNGLQMAFLDGNQPDRLCEPMKQSIEAKGGSVYCEKPLERIELNEDGSISKVVLRGGEEVIADEYVSAMPVDVLKRMIPEQWSTMPYFKQLDELEGIPVINLHMWFDKKLTTIDHLCFSRSPYLSVYADMSTTCRQEFDDDQSMLELVFAPCSPIAGGDVNWIAKSDDEIIQATMGELARLFPKEIASDPAYPGTMKQRTFEGGALPELPNGAKLRKSAVVRVPRSVYAAIPGRNKYRPSQKSPIKNLSLCGCFTSQKFLGSMEGAILAGKLAAEVVAARAVGADAPGDKPIQQHVIDEAAAASPKKPVGCKGRTAVAFGGGYTFDQVIKKEVQEQDPVQLVTS